MGTEPAREGGATPHHLRPADGAARLPGPLGQRYAELLAHGTLVVEYYAPRGRDPQSPHTRDELYVVIAGSGWFVNGSQRHRFAAGDVLFVPAGVVHRFEDFGDDFATWVVFYGPEGGEARRDQDR
jgi:mannose-6-phosphate isomerase-like protein (cupin superfamily)